jgi:cysteine synthase B
LIEATSGNTGIALAMIAQLLDIEIELILPKIPPKNANRAYGATVILTLKKESWVPATMPTKVAEGGYIMLNQFANEDNWKAHYKKLQVQRFGMIRTAP